MRRYIACQNDECSNKGAPYHDHEPADTIVACPVCGEAMSVIPEPLEPPMERKQAA